MKGIGEKTATAITNTFGEDTLSILEANPERIFEVPHIQKARAKDLLKALQDKNTCKTPWSFACPWNWANQGNALIPKVWSKHE